MLVSLRMVVPVLLCVCAMLAMLTVTPVGALQAADSPAAVSDHLDSPFGDTIAELRINDPRWVDRIITNFSAGVGLDPTVLRTGVARCLFRSLSFDGVDLSRPAMLAWRKGPAPLLAIIPLTDRRLFLESFGTGLGEDGPLIRIGERDGTLVYSQNGSDGLIEYRLEVNDSAAFLARDAKECKALIEHMPVRTDGDAPVVLLATNAYLAQISDPITQLSNYLQLPGDPTQALRAVGYQLCKSGWEGMVPQLSLIKIELRAQGESDIKVKAELHAQAESSLGVWIGNQHNVPNRLLGVVRVPTTSLSMGGSIAWQGQHVDEIGAQVLKSRFAGRWNTSADELWRSIWAMLERCGPFAAALDLDYQSNQMSSEWRLLAEQPRAYDLIGIVNTFVQTLTGSPGDALTVPGASGFRQPGSALLGPGSPDLISLASDHAFAASQSTARDAEKVANDVLQHGNTGSPAEEGACIVALGANLTPMINVLVQMYGGLPLIGASPVPMQCTLSGAPEATLIIESVLPLRNLATVLLRGGVVQTLSTPR